MPPVPSGILQGQRQLLSPYVYVVSTDLSVQPLDPGVEHPATQHWTDLQPNTEPTVPRTLRCGALRVGSGNEVYIQHA